MATSVQQRSSDLEQTVGIKGFIGDHEGFSGIIKHRWEDFHVYEVNKEGKTLHLTELISRQDLLADLQKTRVAEKGEEVISADFRVEFSLLESLQNDGYFSLQDIHILENFIKLLANTAESYQTDEDLYQTGSASCLSVKNPPYCLIAGNYKKCLDDLTHVHNLNNLGSPTEVQVYKTLRKAMHIAVRNFLPFLYSETISLEELPEVKTGHISKCSQIYFPGVNNFTTVETTCFQSNNTCGEPLEYLQDRNNDVNSVDQFKGNNSRNNDLKDKCKEEEYLPQFVLRLIPKAQCLIYLFPHLSRSKIRSKQQLPGNDNLTDLIQKTPLITAPVQPLKDTSESETNLSQNDKIIGNPLENTSTLTKEMDNTEGSSHTQLDLKENIFIKNENIIEEKDSSELHVCQCNSKRPKKRKNAHDRRKEKQRQIKADGKCLNCGSKLPQKSISSQHNRWPKERPVYLYFHLYKANRDTAEAINMIAQCANCHPKLFTFAGTKDRRGITVQAVTAFRFSIEQMNKALMHPRWDRSVRISDMKYVKERIALGHLLGNHFKICIRNIEPTMEKKVYEASNSLIKNGFINFFGLQRFGTRKIRTHDIGASILRQDFRKAVHLILGHVSLDIPNLNNNVHSNPPSISETSNAIQPTTNNEKKRLYTESSTTVSQTNSDIEGTESLVHCKRLKLENAVFSNNESQSDQEIFKLSQSASKPVDWITPYITNDNATDALKLLPRHLYLERQLLKTLADMPNNYVGALQQLPKNTLTLYIHSVQSLIWNCVVAYRFEHFGRAPVIGDMVFEQTSPIKQKNNSLTDDSKNRNRMTLLNTPQTEQLVEDIDEDIPVNLSDNELEPEDMWDNQSVNVKTLTEDTIVNYSIYDIVLPIPGDGVEYPDYLKSIYETTCNELLGLNLSDIKSMKKIGLGEYFGTYRHICVCPKNVEYYFIPHVLNGSDKILLSDVDKLLNPSSTYHSHESGDSLCNTGIDNTLNIQKRYPENIETTSKDSLAGSAAVVLSCTLPKSSYLTMACRELFKGKEIVENPHHSNK